MDDTTPAVLARARALLDVHRPDEAVTVLGAGLARDPASYALHLLLAHALWSAGRGPEGAERAFQAARLSPSDPEPHCIRAEIFLDKDWNSKALSSAETACELVPTYPRAHFLRARALIALKLLDGAWDAANRVQELQPHATLGLHARGLVLIKREEWAQAEREYRAALAIAPNDVSLLNNYGLALLNLGRESEAIEQFTRAGQLDARRDVFRKNTAVAARRFLGDTRLNLGRPDAWLTVAVCAAIAYLLASISPRLFEAGVFGAVVIILPFLIVRRRRRMAQLSSAARIALQIDEQNRARAQGISVRVTRIVRVVLGAVLLLSLAGILYGAAHSDSPRHPSSPTSKPFGFDLPTVPCRDTPNGLVPLATPLGPAVCEIVTTTTIP